MKRSMGLALLAMVAACTPAAPTAPEAVVLEIYKPLAESNGERGTTLAGIPMTDELRALVDEADQAAQNEPVFDGDFAGNCQDCTGFVKLKVKERDDAQHAAGRAGVEATFNLMGNEPRSVTWDMVETPAGWRVDNIISAGIDLRKIAQEAVEQAGQAQAAKDDAVECLAYIDLQGLALKAAKPPGDTAALEAASAAWRKKAEELLKPEELAQFYASSVAVYDDLRPEDLKAHADECVAKAPV